MWGCFSHDHKLDLKVVRQTLTGQRYIDNILEPIVYPHQEAYPIFQDDNVGPHRAHIVTDTLAHEGIENLQWPRGSPDMNPIKHVWDRMGRNVCKRNDVFMLGDLVSALVNEWNNLEPPCFLENQCKVCHDEYESYTRVEEDTPVIDVNFWKDAEPDGTGY